MSDTMGILFIVGKGMIWLIIPLLFGLWELRRHRAMMRREASGEAAREAELPRWLTAKRPGAASRPPRRAAPAPAPTPASEPREGEPEPDRRAA